MYANFLKQTLHEATKLAKLQFGKASQIAVKEGDANQVLTQTDIEVGKLIVNAAQQSYPDYNIIDEEAGVIDKGSEYTWVIDPIDGTSNFANGLPQYGIMIGLLYNNQPIAGGVSLPEYGELYIAEKGKGALCNDRPISVTTSNRLLDNLVVYNIDGRHDEPDFTRQEIKTLGEIILNIRNVRNSGSVYDLGALAKGQYGGWLTRTAKIWDLVAPHIIASEAGAVVTDYYGQPIDYSNALAKAADTFTWCMAPAPLHAQLQEVIHKT